MFTEIFFFEISYRLKRPATYIYFFIFFALAFLFIFLAGGAFEGVNLVLPGGGGKILANSPYMINTLISGLSFFGIIIIAAIVGDAVYRDFEHRTHAIFFTKPISKINYLGGRFCGAACIALLVFVGSALGLMIGSFMPWLDASKIGEFHLMYYVQPYLVFVIPNLLFIGIIFFAAATLSRNMLSVYVGSVLFLVLYGVSKSLLANINNDFIAGMLDPFGGTAMHSITKYWTVSEKNSLVAPFSNLLLFNRILWLSIGAIIFGITFLKFRFDQFSSEIKSTKKRLKIAEAKERVGKIIFLNASQNFSVQAQFVQLIQQIKLEFLSIIKSIYFIAIVFAGMVFLYVSGAQIGKIYDTNTFPVTGTVLEILGGSFYLFVLIIIIFYSGELVWKERELKISQIYDALPVSDRSPFVSKLFALILVQVILLLVVMFCGIIIQCCYGYFHFEIGLYIKGLFGIRLIDYALLCVLSLFIQVLVNNKYVGYLVMVVYYLFSIFMGSMGLEHHLYQYASDPGMVYSAMNGYGSFVMPFVWFKLYWALFATLLAIIAKLFWIRGNETSFSQRIKIAKARFNFSTKITTTFVLIAFIGVGGFIFYNTNILNKYVTNYEQEKSAAAYEKTYKKYEHIAQPRITAIKLNVDIYPNQKNIFFKGSFTLKNNSKHSIDSIHVLLNSEAKINFLNLNVSNKKVLNDAKNGYYIYQLEKPLQPNDSIILNMDIAYLTKGFGNNPSDLPVYDNGTFINSSFLPSIGYDANGELSDNAERKKFGLPNKERMASVNDSVARMNTYISNDADWITYDATISTSSDQTALTSGKLVKQWTENNRNYFHYKMDHKMENFYSFFSGRYEIKQENWKNIPITIYYHKGHEYNLERMFRAIKDGLTYYTKNFSPYQFDQMRIVEFPGYASFAQSFPNTIAYSESIGFIADVDDSNPEDIDYPYYVTAHELAHQWWAHQVIGGNVQGSTLMSETMAQYSALMVMKQRYGINKMKIFLKYEMDRYLSGRSTEREKELPLYLVENQPYIHYRKGSVVMYALQDYIGEDSLNNALKKYIQKVAFQYPPYTNSLQFLTYINNAVPDSLKYIVNDMFKKITLYENKTLVATYTKTKDKKYLVHIETNSEKFFADSLGNETNQPLHDWIDIGIFTQKKINGNWTDVPIYLKKHKITNAAQSFDILVDELPVKAGIDPYNKLIDRHPDDNEIDVTEKGLEK